MNNILSNINDIITNNISGFHRYVLTEPFRLSYVSANLCNMLGLTTKDLLSPNKDLYALRVHPEDTGAYLKFLQNLSLNIGTLTTDYRLIKKDGSIIFVRDTCTSKKLDDGTVVGDSVLTDITQIKNEYNNLNFINKSLPCGYVKFTCEKQPKVTYINKQMMDFLRFPKEQQGELNYLELYKDNVFLMVPMEHRRRFALFLNRVYTQNTPIAGEITLQRCDGSLAYMYGLVTKSVNFNGEEEFSSVCIDITKQHQAKKANETNRYIKALFDVYEKIFEYNLNTNTVNCLYSNESSRFKFIENIPMQMEDATEKWITSTVVEDEREKVREFFNSFYKKKLFKLGKKPPQINYRAVSGSGEIKNYSGIFIEMDSAVSLFCCRCIPKSDDLLNEKSLEPIMRFTDGVAAFKITEDERVTPLYSSDNVCNFFGFTKDEWLLLTKKSTPLKEFVLKCEVDYKEFKKLLQNGEVEFTYFDLTTKTERHIKAICSQKTQGSMPRYIMLYNVNNKETPQDPNGQNLGKVVIRTFGYFDVFVNGKPIAFRNKKSKELFALLVDRRGGYVSSSEAISFLWEDEPVSPVTLARYRKVAFRLRNILEEYGIGDVVESVDGKRRIVTELVRCDLYDYLTGKKEYSKLFKGSYLTNYSWAETTLAGLSGNALY